jgi:Uncharacterized conserved protein
MLVYRIVHKIYSKGLYASGIQGRWNSAGKKVIYSAESIALAFLENMVRRQGVGFNQDFKIMMIEIPDEIDITSISPDQLKDGWRNSNDYSKCQSLGDQWYNEAKTLILKVPSAILPESYNYVINTQHVAFKNVQIITTSDLLPDKRIENLLKKYKRE